MRGVPFGTRLPVIDLALPDRAWNLSAPESLALLWGPETSDTWTVSLGLLELAVRHGLSLRMVRSRKFGIVPITRLILSGRIEPSAFGSELIDAVWRSSPNPRSFRGGISGLPVDAMADRLLKPPATSRAALSSPVPLGSLFVTKHILPSLRRQGIYDDVVPNRITPHGQERLRELRQFMEVGRSVIAGMGEPADALDYVERAGSSVLLVRGLAPALTRLVRFYGSPASWRPPDVADHRFESRAPVSDDLRDSIPVRALVRVIGPGANDDVDMALYAITTEVQRRWTALYRRVTPGFGTGE
jgi:hypothetical protein